MLIHYYFVAAIVVISPQLIVVFGSKDKIPGFVKLSTEIISIVYDIMKES